MGSLHPRLLAGVWSLCVSFLHILAVWRWRGGSVCVCVWQLSLESSASSSMLPPWNFWLNSFMEKWETPSTDPVSDPPRSLPASQMGVGGEEGSTMGSSGSRRLGLPPGGSLRDRGGGRLPGRGTREGSAVPLLAQLWHLQSGVRRWYPSPALLHPPTLPRYPPCTPALCALPTIPDLFGCPNTCICLREDPSS